MIESSLDNALRMNNNHVIILCVVDGSTPSSSSTNEDDEEEEEEEEEKEEEEEEDKDELDSASVDSAENVAVDVEKLDDDDEEDIDSNKDELTRKRHNDDASPLDYAKRQKFFEPIYGHNHPLVPGLQPLIYGQIPVSLPLQTHPVPTLVNHAPKILTTVYPLPLTPTQWLKQAHSPTATYPPHPLISPAVPVTGAKAPMPCTWPCRPLQPHHPAISPRQDDKFMFVRLADSTHWQCKLCNRVFTSQGSLRAHARIHNNEKPYRCKYCQRPFTQASTLRSHERLHTGEKPYKCDTCGKTFTQSAGLRSHKKTHTPR